MNNKNKSTKEQGISDISKIRVGDTIKLHYKFTEKDKDRVQIFEGVIIAQKGAGVSKNMTIRGAAAGLMMEKIIPVHSPNIKKIEIIKSGKVRRAKLYYLRNVTGKRAKLKKRTEKLDIENKKEED